MKMTMSFKSPVTRTLVRFDDDRIRKQLDRAERRNLFRAGKFTRTTAKRSVRKRKKPSKPGNPPHSHVGTLRKLIFYAWDLTSRTMLVGPFRTLPTGGRRNRTRMVDRATGAEVLEKGGSVIRTVPKPRGTRRKQTGRMTRRRVRRIREEYKRRGHQEDLTQKLVTVAPRPYMSAALVKTMPRFPKLWSNSIKVA